MFDTLFGEGQYGFKMLFAFIVVFGLLALALWLVRRFGGARLGSPAARGRQPRLAVIDAATVDGRRRLVLIRRDNVEHLLIIGGPTDVVIEQNIVRAAAAPREAPAARPPAAPDTLPRPVPLGEGAMWPLQPEPAARVEPPPRPDPALRPAPRPPAAVEDNMQWSEPAAPAPPQAPPLPPRERRPRAADSLSGLAEELGRAPASADDGAVEQPAPRQPGRRIPRPQVVPAPPPAAAEPELNPAADQNLAEMAHRLEAALRRPGGDDGRAAAAAAPRPAAAAPEEENLARPATRGDVRPARADGRPAPQKSLYDSLEQEMASLLGRPNGRS